MRLAVHALRAAFGTSSQSRWKACALALFLIAAASAPGADSGSAKQSATELATQLIAQRCLACHNSQTKSSGLDLSSRGAAELGGERGPAFVAGDAQSSLMYRRVAAAEMPLGNPLPESEREVIRQWIEAGAPWTGSLGEPTTDRPRAGLDWWSLQPIGDTTPPARDEFPAPWSPSPIDRWVRARLQAEGLSPSPPAERRVLIRRATFDLLGLPPTPAEVGAFVKDASGNAYEKLIDRLLSSPRYGERWARHWLDVARFSESEGFERDWMRENAWPYRDYVIRSLNDDKSYQQFAKEQIAGDVIEPVTHEGIVATGFLVSGPYDAVGLTSAVGEQRKIVRENQLEEMISAVSQTFLGMTANCARCHDHKFDPIPQKEYYRLKAAFEGVWLGERDLITPAELDARRTQAEPLEKRIAQIEDEIAMLLRPARDGVLRERGFAAAENVPAPIAQWSFDLDTRDLNGSLHLKPNEDFEIAQGRLTHAREKDPPLEDSGVKSAKLPRDLREKTLEVWVAVKEVPKKGETIFFIRNIEGYRGAAYDGIQYAAGETKQWRNGSTASFRSLDLEAPPEEATPGDLIHIAVSYGSDNSIHLYRNGKPYEIPYIPELKEGPGLLQTYLSGEAEVVFRNPASLEIDEARIYDSALSDQQIAASYQAGAPSVSLDDLRGAMRKRERIKFDKLHREVEQLRAELNSIPRPGKIYAAEIRDPEPTHILIRGDISQQGDLVSAGGLSSVSGLSAEFGLSPDAPESQRRARLADWIATPDNPLFARAIVNRVWHYHFGRGFVSNPNDLGFNGGAPSHPELLDWLASQLIADGWSLKKLHKRIMMSQTYRQSSAYNAKTAEVDADNRLLWRYSPKRLEGEAVRDSMLMLSGKINYTMGGPSFRPFETKRIGSLEHYHRIDSDDAGFQRRTVYRMNINSGTDPMLDSLDCPIPAVKTPQRIVTTTPLQALSLMNNAFAVRQAKAFAERVASQAGADQRRQIDRAFQLALGRPPVPDEVEWSESLAGEGGLESLCWGLFNASEFLYVN
jgi:cytochrome c553